MQVCCGKLFPLCVIILFHLLCASPLAYALFEQRWTSKTSHPSQQQSSTTLQTCHRPVQMSYCPHKKVLYITGMSENEQMGSLFRRTFLVPFHFCNVCIIFHCTLPAGGEDKMLVMCRKVIQPWKRWHKLYAALFTYHCVYPQMVFIYICVCVHVCLYKSQHSSMCILDQDVETLNTALYKAQVFLVRPWFLSLHPKGFKRLAFLLGMSLCTAALERAHASCSFCRHYTTDLFYCHSFILPNSISNQTGWRMYFLQNGIMGI